MFRTLHSFSIPVRAATRKGRIVGRRPSNDHETFERFEDVASLSCVAKLADPGVQSPALISAKANVL